VEVESFPFCYVTQHGSAHRMSQRIETLHAVKLPFARTR